MNGFRNQISRYLLTVIALVGIASCETEDPILIDADERCAETLTTEPEEAKPDSTVMRVLLHCSDAMKNTINATMTPSTESGKGNEAVINKATVYLYDSKTKRLYKEFNLSGIKANSAYSKSTYDISYVTDSVWVRIGEYDVFVIANCDCTPTGIINEYDLLNSIDETTYNSGVLQSIKSTGVVMTNRPYANLNVKFDISTENLIRNVNVDLERVLAKVSLEQESGYYELKNGDEIYATVNLTNVKAVNVPKQYYFFRHTASLTTFTEPELKDYFTERDLDDDHVYVIDPFFFRKTFDTASDSALTDRFYAEWYKRQDYTVEAPISYPGKSYLYVTECTSYKDAQKKCYVTGILLKGAVSPSSSSVYYWDSATNKPTTDIYPEHWPDTLYFRNFKFYESISDLNKCQGLTLDEKKQGMYSDNELSEYNTKQIVKSMGSYQTKYAYWIRHYPNESDDTMEEMEFAIVRNSYYVLKLHAITGIGSSAVDGGNFFKNVEPNKYTDIEVEP